MQSLKFIFVATSTIVCVFGAVTSVMAQAGGQPGTNVFDDRIPVQTTDAETVCPIAGGCGVTLFLVPEGKRLVIEHVSWRSHYLFPEPGQSTVVLINTGFEGTDQQVYLGIADTAGSGGSALHVLSKAVKIYAQELRNVSCVGESPQGETFSFIGCTITGFLENE